MSPLVRIARRCNLQGSGVVLWYIAVIVTLSLALAIYVDLFAK